MGISALISGGSQIASSAISASAARHASDQQMAMYQQTRSDLSPYMTTGNSALSQLAKLWGIGPGGSGIPDTAAMTSALQNLPGYQFGLNQGTTALDQAAASKGLVLSGGQLESQQQFGQNYAMQQAWNPYISQLNSLSSLGENAAAGVGGFGATAATNAGSATMAGGNAAGAGILGAGQTLAGVFQPSASSYGGLGGGLNTAANTGFGSNTAAGDPLAGLY